MRKINSVIAHLGIKLVKGKDYFYFAALLGTPMNTYVPAPVYTPRLSDLSFGEWVVLAGGATFRP